MSRRLPRWIAAAGLLLLVALHLDFWRGDRGGVVLGWVPEELVYRLGWMLLAMVYLWYFCRHVWSHEGDRP